MSMHALKNKVYTLSAIERLATGDYMIAAERFQYVVMNVFLYSDNKQQQSNSLISPSGGDSVIDRSSSSKNI